ncbi:MAG: phosphoribosylamine--glycine ligase [Pseudomonadota bacterium]
MTTVLVLGSGAREHALVTACAPHATRVVAAPGNDGMRAEAEVVACDLRDYGALLALARNVAADLVIVGPEDPLVAGVTDVLEAGGFAVLGPNKAAARLEGSKTFMKAVAAEAGVPTAAHASFDDETAALAHLAEVGAPRVIKADGLAAGKGVTVAGDVETARAAVRACFAGRFGQAGARVVIEEALDGPEISAFVLCDGAGGTVWLGDAQDHKRLGDGDTGANTGGMGAYSPAPVLTDALRETVMAEIVRPTLDAMAARGTPFKGVLFCGLMLTADGLKLLEFNTRFGDPEAQVLLPRITGDIVALFQVAARGDLASVAPPELSPTAALGVVLAAPGYPDAPRKGDAIGGLDADGQLADPVEGARIVHAATRREGEGWSAQGGRVLTVVGTGKTIADAQAGAYRAAGRIDWPDAQMRRDIGWRALPADGLIATGKTKRVVRGETPHTVRLEAIDRLTGGDAARVSEIEAIGRAKTRQAANALTLLKRAGIPTAFLEQAGEDALLCRACRMLPLEFVVRRYAFGSYLKRNPSAASTPPTRFEAPVLELFHKHSVVLPPHVEAPTQMEEGEARTRFLKDGAWPQGVHADPYIATGEAAWGLYDSKTPVTGAPLMTITPALSDEALDLALQTIVLPAFDALEAAWGRIDTEHGPVALTDIKFELGHDEETGDLLLADVVDNDSWRVWPGGDPARQIDKQAFRDGAAEAEVTQNYGLVTRLTERFNEGV